MACPFISSKSQQKSSDPEDFDLDICCPIPHIGPQRICSKRPILLNYPVYLRNTIHHPLQMQKIRTLDIMEKLMPFDDFNKEGNRFFHLEDYEKALDCYEHAYGLFKYLQLANPNEEAGDIEISIICNSGKTNEDLNFRNSALANALSNMTVAYCKLRNYNEALQAISEAIEYKPNDALLLYRRAKVRVCNLKDECYEAAIKDLRKAISINEKYEDALEKFAEVKRLREKIFSDIINEISSSYCKSKWDSNLEVSGEKELEHKIIQKMEEKYYEMISFYIENNKYSNLTRIREEMKTLQLILLKMDYVFGLEFSNPDLISAITQKNTKNKPLNPEALDIVKRTLITLLFTEGKFNEQLLSYCMEKCTEDDQKKSKPEKKPQKCFGLFSYSILALIIGLILYKCLQPLNSPNNPIN